MFHKLIKQLLAIAGFTQADAAQQMNYKTPSAFQSVISKQDMRLTVLYNICKLCGFDIIITNGKGITISIGDYIDEQQHP